MKQVVKLNEESRRQISDIEQKCEKLAEKLLNKYKTDFQTEEENLAVDLVRTIKGRHASENDVFENDYESILELGIETEDEFFPNAYIPIWKCKQEMFHSVGYLTNLDMDSIEKKMMLMIEEMLADRVEGEKYE
ncbi:MULTISPECIES: hypothetical protein [Bacillaceae]|uniref:Uncharacterized protein n=1 Tax=Cytobacillus firmus TaxID=1399 RepID=A0AA46PHL5_CYTFI|nr:MULTISPECIES: hypothetical protein [Bacillaceae]MCC3648045.1 hypothetical protein [Cytobacillus oceanisediminis]MCS0653856.1 hypothetical protein [Cytobacillus firmus]MCU1805952.1 hypothetical protein [Cytobacillus firmus]UYG94918.1 hypothetical protein OD459_22470 [Cytobacillus firmus]WHY32729.1 hypothetical protein QNH44_17085 [Cytobacillus firmus]